DAPDDTPDVQHHDPANPAANADAQQAVTFPAMIIEVEEEIGSECHHNDGEGAQDRPLVDFHDHGRKKDQSKSDRPDQEKQAHDSPAGAPAVTRVYRNNVVPPIS